MPSTALAPSLSGGPPPAPSLTGGSQPPALTDALAQYTKSEAQAGDTETKELKSLEGEAGRLVPPKLEVPPPPTPHSTNPMQVWGSMAMGLAALGSLMTRTPLTTAMNAAAEVIKGYRQGDVDAANQAFQTWKAASENAVQLANFQQKAYDEAMASVERREHMTIEEKANADKQAEANLRGVLTAFNDQTGLQRLEQAGYLGVQHLQIQRAQWQNKLEVESVKLDELHALNQAKAQLTESPDFKSANPGQQAKMLSGLVHEYAPDLVSTHDPFSNPQSRVAMISKIDAMPPVKQYMTASTANSIIQKLASEPDIANNPESQITLVDKYIQLATGSTRPGIAQYQKLLGAQTLNDYTAMLAGKMSHHPILGPDQITNLANSARYEAEAAKIDRDNLLKSPQLKDIAEGLHMLGGQDDDHPANAGPHYHSAVTELLKHKGKPDEAQIRQFFDQRYGAGAAEKLMGE